MKESMKLLLSREDMLWFSFAKKSSILVIVLPMQLLMQLLILLPPLLFVLVRLPAD